jgi:hypothetical protein
MTFKTAVFANTRFRSFRGFSSDQCLKLGVDGLALLSQLDDPKQNLVVDHVFVSLLELEWRVAHAVPWLRNHVAGRARLG